MHRETYRDTNTRDNVDIKTVNGKHSSVHAGYLYLDEMRHFTLNCTVFKAKRCSEILI